jgi:hypothetical protein
LFEKCRKKFDKNLKIPSLIKDFKTISGKVNLKIDKERDVITEEALIFIKDEALIYTKLKKLS